MHGHVRLAVGVVVSDHTDQVVTGSPQCLGKRPSKRE